MKTIRKRAIFKSLCRTHNSRSGVRWNRVAHGLRQLPYYQKSFGLNRYLIQDIENKKIIVAKTSDEALSEFIVYFYGAVQYNRDVTIDKLEEGEQNVSRQKRISYPGR